jgi:membrane protein YqaA with SNARE-associated domain
MAVLIIKSAVWGLVRRFGAFAFIPIGIIDNSLIPTFGSMDVFLVVLAASNHELWWYYALMATLGAVIGAYITYRISAKGGKEMLEKKLRKKNSEKAYRVFDRWGFWAIFFAVLAPPPFPASPVLATAGAMQYSRKKFLLAAGWGRAVRYTITAWLASRYGRHIFTFFSKYYKPAFWTLLVLGIAGGIAALVWYMRSRRKHGEVADAARPGIKAA